ncbi:MAG: hypothetical protein ACREJU_13670 [Nitrospiraceae bacterium]
MMRLFFACAFLSVTMFAGCASTTRPQPVHYPITSGYHSTLPLRDARILVWAKQPVLGMATTWLQTHGLTVIPPNRLGPLMTPELQNALTYTSDDMPIILRHAKSVHAALVLFADFDVTAEAASRAIGNFEPVHAVNVTVLGLNANTSEIEWKGNARYPPRPQLPADALVHLTCQALATAWGFRPGGQLEIPSGMMCTAGQTERTLAP